MKYYAFATALLVFLGCTPGTDTPLPDAVQHSSGAMVLLGDRTGIMFANNLTETDEINRLSYEYFYNGGGVAAGDVNGDGLPDLYFTGNMVQDKLYLNRGNMRFVDITAQAGILPHSGWHTGVTMADVNGDSHLDIYVSRSGWFTDPEMRRNYLYINDGKGAFTEQAKSFGLDDGGYGVQAVFFDPDRDGDLDVYVLNNPEDKPPLEDYRSYREAIGRGEHTTDRFYENQDGRFTDQTEAWGFRNYGYRHGVSVGDIDNDGWPDMYVSSDFDDPDYLYINTGQKRFVDRITQYTNHISMFSMGCDLGDLNNDGWLDMSIVDMTPGDHERSKQNMPSMDPEKFYALVEHGFHHQYMVNSLQLNTGLGYFAEIANMAGVAYTDWSWATLWLDWDLDGWQDMFVSNGIKRDVLNNDVRLKTAEMIRQGVKVHPTELLEIIPGTKLHNKFYRNSGDLTFEDRSLEWGGDTPYNSNGAAYADLDGDGDWDLVLNNVDDPAVILEGKATEKGGRYFKVRKHPNMYWPVWLGSRLTLYSGSEMQTQEIMSTRGFISSVEPVALFGLGEWQALDSLVVRWGDGTSTLVPGPLTANSTNSFRTSDGVARQERADSAGLFAPVSPPAWIHTESVYDDFAREVLLPHKLSSIGPALASGDVNGDGLEDLFFGGAAGQAGSLWLQTADGGWQETSATPWQSDAEKEDQIALFFDADNDGDLDLFVGHGSNEFEENDPLHTDNLYMNMGNGDFASSRRRFPVENTWAAAAADIDDDGDMDLFTASGNVPYRYPRAGKHTLWLNNAGTFTASRTDFSALGMLRTVAFADVDSDGDPDLLAAGEWTGIEVWKNTAGKFSPDDGNVALREAKGWWQCIVVADLDGDGDADFIAGNIGLNNKFHPSKEAPLKLFAGDFDDNGTIDHVLSKEYKGQYVPVRGRECSSEQMPFIAEKYPTFQSFAEASLADILGSQQLKASDELSATTFAHVVGINEGGVFTLKQLPNAVQIAPARSIVVHDISGDGNQDVILAGNFFDVEVETVRYDAGTGFVLFGEGNGNFNAVPTHQAGLLLTGDVRGAIFLECRGELVAAVNNGPVVAYRLVGE